MARTKRIGALLPATNPVVEPDFYRVIPDGVTVHFERMWNGRWGGANLGYRKMKNIW